MTKQTFTKELKQGSRKQDFVKAIGKPKELFGYQRSYKLVFYKCLFENENWKNGVECKHFAEIFRDFYVSRKRAGKISDLNVDKVIERPEESSTEQILSLIIKNPYNAISGKGFVGIARRGSSEFFELEPQLRNELSEADIIEIRQLVDDKLEYYFNRIDNETSDSNMKQVIEKFINEYVTVKQEVFSGNPFGAFVRSEIPNAIYDSKIVDKKTHLITGSVGQGNWAMVPWICIFDKKVTTSAQKGVYIVYLLSKDGKSLYLTFNQGCTDIRATHSKKETIKIMRERAKEVIAEIDARGFNTDENINLGEGLTELGELYQKGTIFYKEYKQGEVPSEMELREDLQKMMDIYREYVNPNSVEAWWPSLSKYSPGISKEKWLDILKDTSIVTENAYFALAAMYDFGGIATCRQLEEQYGKTSDFYRATLGVQLASKIKTLLSLPYATEETNSKVWPILFQGRKADAEEAGNYVWKMRPELYEALKEFNILEYLSKGGDEEMETKEILEHIKAYIEDKGFTYKDNLIDNFYLSLKSKPFVILAGTSGTGKTRLVRLFAEAIDANYKLVSVRPDWSDSSDLFGHVNLNNEFVPGAIIDYVKQAKEDPENPYFLCLDEMNLARVEYYLSDFLSIIETRHRDGKRIVTDEIILDNAAKVAYPKMIIPDNLYVVGTVNMDETTFPFSKKVLDRANTIEFSYVDLIPGSNEDGLMAPLTPIKLKNDFLVTEYITLKADTEESDYNLIYGICSELQDINLILQKANAHVGYRVRDEIVFYMLNNNNANLLPYEEAFDFEIMQKILPRIQGSSGSVKEMLCELFKTFAGDYTGLSQASISEQMEEYINGKSCRYKRSAEKICYMMRRFEEDGFTSYWL